MKNFNWTQFTKRIAIKSDLTSIYNAWTQSEEIQKWFLSEARFYDSNQKLIEAKDNIHKGYTYEWRWYAQDFQETGNILGTNGKDHLAFTFAGNCTVKVTLIQKKDYVIIELIHKDIPQDDESKEGIRLGCAFGWSFYLVNLKSYLEGGIDLRNKDCDIQNVVNN